jgi:predicted N-acetyltransferase YhbS
MRNPVRDTPAPGPSSAASLIRAMTEGDLPAASRLSAASFGIDVSDDRGARRWRERVAYALATDPEGAFVAERDGRLIGVAEVICRERLWCLSLLSVQPGLQSTGAGRALMARALEYGARTDCGLIVSSNDPRALRLYALSGFSLVPTFQAEGQLDRSKLPRVDARVRECSTDLEPLAGIAREVRGAPYTQELEYAVRRGAQVMRFGDRGFVVAQPGHGVWLLVARDDEAATALLWAGLELGGDPARPSIRWITSGQDWAIDVAVRARLRLTAYGALAVRGRPGSLRPFIPSGPFA